MPAGAEPTRTLDSSSYDAKHPRWLIWRGSFTGDYWAMPPRGHPTRRELASARDLDGLAQSLAEAEEQHDL